MASHSPHRADHIDIAQVSAPLAALWRLLNGASDIETAESRRERAAVEAANKGKKPRDRIYMPDGFARDSQAWADAQQIGLTPYECAAPDTQRNAQADLLGNAPVTQPRFFLPQIAQEGPYHFGEGAVLQEELDVQDGGLCFGPVGSDATHVLFYCGRGVCCMTRTDWRAGKRMCVGC